MSDNQTENEPEKVIRNLETVSSNPKIKGKIEEILGETTKYLNRLATPELKNSYASHIASKIRDIDPDGFDSLVNETGVTHFRIGDQVVSLEEILKPKDFKFER